MRRVVDDEVHAGEVLERPDVAALPADDPALHVVEGSSTTVTVVSAVDSPRRAAARRPPIPAPGASTRRAPRPRASERVARARAGPALPHARAPAPRASGLRQPCHVLELGELGVLRVLELVLELADVLFPVGETLIATSELLEPRSISISFARTRSSIFSTCARRSVSSASISLPNGPPARGPRRLRLAPHGVALAACILQELVADPAGLRHAGRAEDRDRQEREGGSYSDPDCDSDPDLHAAGSSVEDPAAWRRIHHAPGLRGRSIREKPYVPGRSRDLPESRCATCARPPSRRT